MKPQPDRDCIHVMRRIMEDLDDWGKWCVLCFATWLLMTQKTRRAWLRIMWGQWADWIR